VDIGDISDGVVGIKTSPTTPGAGFVFVFVVCLVAAAVVAFLSSSSLSSSQSPSFTITVDVDKRINSTTSRPLAEHDETNTNAISQLTHLHYLPRRLLKTTTRQHGQGSRIARARR
jgi:hypothetical protein